MANTYDENGMLATVAIEIYSYTFNLSELRVYIEQITNDYKIKKQNKLGSQVYYFNEIIQPIGMTNMGDLDYSTARKNLIFSMTPFYTSKQLENVFGDQIDVLIQRLTHFINNPEWYVKRGIPYTFGILLHGSPWVWKRALLRLYLTLHNDIS